MRFTRWKGLLSALFGFCLFTGCMQAHFDDGASTRLLANANCSGIASVSSTIYCAYAAAISNPKLTGSGTASSPYEICSPYQLNAIAADTTMFSSHIKLTADIDMSCIAGNHTPIGSAASPFRGYFDGNSKTIRNWSYNDSTQDNVGVFGYLDEGATVRYLTINGRVTGKDYVGLAVGYGGVSHLLRVSTAGTVTGSSSVGGVVGAQGIGATNQCSSSATVTGVNDVGGIVGQTSVVASSYFTGRVVASGTNSGGIMGYGGESQVHNSFSSGTITSTGPNVGGLVGSLGRRIADSYSTGSVSGTTNVGGLVGSSNATIVNSFTTASVAGSGGTLTDVGYLRATSGGSTTNSYYWPGAGCDADALVAGTQDCGTVASGTVTSASVFHSRTNEPLASWDFQNETAKGTGDYWALQSSAYPVAWYVDPSSTGIPFFDGNGTLDDPYQIATTSQFNLIAANPRWMEKHYKLTANLNFSGVTPKQIGSFAAPFSGNFDGNSKTIQNYVAGSTLSDAQAMFGVALSPSTIQDLTVTNAFVQGAFYSSLLVGQSTATIEGVSVAGTLTAGWHSGGLVGIASGSIIDSSASVFIVSTGGARGGLVGTSIASIVRSVAAATITGGAQYTGGLVGLMNSGSVVNSIASGSIGDGTQNNCGGLVGRVTGTVSNSYSTSDVNCLGHSGGLVGRVVGGTVTNGFATGSVRGNGGATQVGPLVGSMTTGTVTNSWVVSGTICDSSTAGGTQACNTSYYAGQAAAVSDFHNPGTAPLSSWDFVTTWQSDLLSLPVLR